MEPFAFIETRIDAIIVDPHVPRETIGSRRERNPLRQAAKNVAAYSISRHFPGLQGPQVLQVVKRFHNAILSLIRVLVNTY
ncbi:hypothetical protein XI25_19065 [Paenibacillus sp. DMB20]|nr:hypothetical protein XI25_19065 [Paenibacillus sp. DMB20]